MKKKEFSKYVKRYSIFPEYIILTKKNLKIPKPKEYIYMSKIIPQYSKDNR